MTTAKKTTKKKRNPYGGVFSDKDLNEHVDDYKEKQKNYTGGEGGKYPVYLNLDEGEEATVRFLEKDPVKFYQHRVYDPDLKDGSGGIRVFSCTRDANCPLCTAGDKSTFKVAWQVVHIDNLDRNGDVVPRVKLFVKGIRFAEYYAKKTQKKDPTKQDVILERIGSGQNTQYLFSEWGDKGTVDFDEEELVDLEDYFGLDDEKFEAMERVGEHLEEKGDGGGSGKKSYSGPKKGKRSRLEDDDEDDDDIPI